jgi:hypothetical protein
MLQRARLRDLIKRSGEMLAHDPQQPPRLLRAVCKSRSHTSRARRARGRIQNSAVDMDEGTFPGIEDECRTVKYWSGTSIT